VTHVVLHGRVVGRGDGGEHGQGSFFAVGALAIAVTTPALAYERHYDFGQIWVDAVRPHERDPALSAPPRDVMRHQPNPTFYGRPHDPSGNIILEGAR
jgi:hypothetical protein